MALHYRDLFGRETEHPLFGFNIRRKVYPSCWKERYKSTPKYETTERTFAQPRFAGRNTFWVEHFGRQTVNELLDTMDAGSLNGLEETEIRVLGEQRGPHCGCADDAGECIVRLVSRHRAAARRANVIISTDGTAPYLVL